MYRYDMIALQKWLANQISLISSDIIVDAANIFCSGDNFYIEWLFNDKKSSGLFDFHMKMKRPSLEKEFPLLETLYLNSIRKVYDLRYCLLKYMVNYIREYKYLASDKIEYMYNNLLFYFVDPDDIDIFESEYFLPIPRI